MNDDGVRDRVRAAYNATGGKWALGPTRIYARLATELVAHSPIGVSGLLVLDAGAGTGALSAALVTAGARAICIDLAFEMLAAADVRGPRAAGDLTELPLQTAGLDAAGAAFSLSHVVDPLHALRELRRVVRPGGLILASSYGGPNVHPAKTYVDDLATSFGFRSPEWYRTLKQTTEPLMGSVDAWHDLAGAAGLVDVEVALEQVDLGLADPREMVAWRLGMPRLAPFLTEHPTLREEIEARAIELLGSDPEPYEPLVLFVAARCP